MNHSIVIRTYLEDIGHSECRAISDWNARCSVPPAIEQGACHPIVTVPQQVIGRVYGQLESGVAAWPAGGGVEALRPAGVAPKSRIRAFRWRAQCGSDGYGRRLRWRRPRTTSSTSRTAIGSPARFAIAIEAS